MNDVVDQTRPFTVRFDLCMFLAIQRKNVFYSIYSIQYKNSCLAASDLFDYMFTQSIKFYTFYYTYLREQVFENSDLSNRE